jgi:phosphopantothenoylcysteine synthetase/decarboxylase
MTSTKQLEVPESAMTEVAELIAQRELTVTIVGPHGEIENAIVIEVEYEPEEREAVHALEDFIEDQWAELDDEEDDDDDDDDEEDEDDDEEDEDEEDDD